MGLFSRWFSKPEKELDRLIEEIDINLSNNYKSVAHAARERLGERTREMYELRLIGEESYKHYICVYDQYTEMMKNYRH